MSDYETRKAFIMARELSPWSARKEKHLRRSLRIVAHWKKHGPGATADRFGITRTRVHAHVTRHQRQTQFGEWKI